MSNCARVSTGLSGIRPPESRTKACGGEGQKIAC